MAFVKWLKWLLWDTLRCTHDPGPWRMRECGMGKVQYCTKCGKCIGLI